MSDRSHFWAFLIWKIAAGIAAGFLIAMAGTRFIPDASLVMYVVLPLALLAAAGFKARRFLPYTLGYSIGNAAFLGVIVYALSKLQ